MFRFFSTRVSSGRRMAALLMLGGMMVLSRVEAQNMWLNVSTPASTVGISNNLTFTITVTNLTTTSQTVVVTNVMPATAQFVGVSFGQASYPYTNIGLNTIFTVGVLATNSIAQMAVTILPTATGNITNTVWVATNGVAAIVGPVGILVTNALPVADLAVGMTGPSALVFSNDWVVCGVSVTNLGPNSAPNVILTSSLPPGVAFKSATPSVPSPSIQGSNVIFNLGTLSNQVSMNFQLTVQPATAGSLVFSSTFNTNSVIDPNPGNNTASIAVAVSNFFAGQLTVVTNSPQTTNYQNGFIEQGVSLSNTGTNAVPAARVVVSGLKGNRLFNAVGTNNGNPFVVYANTLDTNQSVTLLLQYSVPNRSAFPFANSQLQPYAVSLPDLTPPPATLTSTNINISRIVRRANGTMLIEWPSITNQTYTVVYSDDALFANAMMAPPSIVAPANRTQWIDYGPPATVSHPTNAPQRFYRIFLNP